MEFLIPIITLLLLVFKALDQFLGLGLIEKLIFPNIPENFTSVGPCIVVITEE